MFKTQFTNTLQGPRYCSYVLALALSTTTSTSYAHGENNNAIDSKLPDIELFPQQAQNKSAPLYPTDTQVAITGELTILHADDEHDLGGRYFYVLEDKLNDKRFKLDFIDTVPDFLSSGDTITVWGIVNGSRITLTADDVQAASTAKALTSNMPTSTGEQHTLVIVADFMDAQVACPVHEIEDRMFYDPAGYSVAEFYATVSDNLTWFTGAVVGPYTIDYASTDTCNLGTMSQAADQAVISAGTDLSQYQRIVYVLPKENTCGYSGVGEANKSPTRSWVFRCGTTGLYAHEIGHNLGMNHSATPTSEYGDKSDIMGTTVLRSPNAPHQEQMDWLATNSVDLVTQSGHYDIAPLELIGGVPLAPQVLKIAKPDTNEVYYLSYRQPVHYDSALSSTYTRGINIHRYKGDGSYRRTYFLAALNDGESFTDSVNGFTFTQTSHSAEYASVEISIDTIDNCIANTPAVSSTPTNQTGEAGSTLSYQVTITNNDEVSCSSTTFNVNSFTPNNWASTVSQSQLHLAPGASGSISVSFTSPADANAGDYKLDIDVSGIDLMHNRTQYVNYNVVVSEPPVIDSTPPSSPKNLTARKKRNRINLSWTASTDNVGVAGYEIWRNAQMIAISQTASFTDTNIRKNTDYSYSIKAYDAAGNVSIASQSVSITQQTSGQGGRGGRK